MELIGKLSKALEKFAVVLATTILILVFCLVCTGVVFRILGNSFSMSEELSRWGLISICFIGASAALKQKQHIGVNMLLQAMPLKLSKVLITAGYLISFVLLVYASFYSLKAALAAEGKIGRASCRETV